MCVYKTHHSKRDTHGFTTDTADWILLDMFSSCFIMGVRDIMEISIRGGKPYFVCSRYESGFNGCCVVLAGLLFFFCGGGNSMYSFLAVTGEEGPYCEVGWGGLKFVGGGGLVGVVLSWAHTYIHAGAFSWWW